MTLYVGTSGWAYPEWRPDFYPHGMARSRFLEHYAGVFDACEINASFYRLQEEATYARWMRETPGHFRFAVKVHRRISHAREWGAEGQGAFVEQFLASLAPLDPKLGPLLLQLPPHRERDDEALARLLGWFGRRTVAVEFRHDSWARPEVTRVVNDSGGTVCVADTDGDVPARLPDGDISYVRLRRLHYTPRQRKTWRELLVETAASKDVYVFGKHETADPADAYAGVGLARHLVEAATRSGVRPPLGERRGVLRRGTRV